MAHNLKLHIPSFSSKLGDISTGGGDDAGEGQQDGDGYTPSCRFRNQGSGYVTGTQVLSGGILPGFSQALSDGRTQRGNLGRNVPQAEAPPYHTPFPACSSGGWVEHPAWVQRRQPAPPQNWELGSTISSRGPAYAERSTLMVWLNPGSGRFGGPQSCAPENGHKEDGRAQSQPENQA